MNKSAIAKDRSVITGETTLHGFFRSIKPDSKTARFVTIQGNLLECDVTEEVATIAAQNINTTIRLEGVAEWDPKTFEIVSFSASSAVCIQHRIADAFKYFSEKYGHYFDAIDDVDAFVGSYRE